MSIPAPDEEVLAEAAETFAILASPVRLHLLWLLARQPSDVTTLAEAVGVSTALVSQHLAKLRLADLVSARRKGKRQIYLLDDPTSSPSSSKPSTTTTSTENGTDHRPMRHPPAWTSARGPSGDGHGVGQAGGEPGQALGHHLGEISGVVTATGQDP